MKVKYCTWTCRCGIAYSVDSKDPDLHLLSDRFKCWETHPPCRYYFNRDDSKKPGSVVRAVEIYKVLMNLGATEERKCAPADLKKLEGKRIERLLVEQAPDSDRSLITGFVLEGGITVHLAPSTKGVTVFKVTRG